MTTSTMSWGFCIVMLLICRSNSAQVYNPHTLIQKLLSNYIKEEPPSSPTEVKLGVYVNGIESIDYSANMQVTMNMYMRHSWKDQRLEFNPDQVQGNVSEITLGSDYWQNIWIPDIFFRNAIKVDRHQTMTEHVLIKVRSSGKIWMVTHMTASFRCPMNLQKYPFDTQLCPFTFESYKYTMETLYLTWLDSAVEIDPSMRLEKYTLTKIIKYDCSQNYTGGAFPCLEFGLVLKRDSGYFFMKVFMPTIMVVIMSWFCLWVDKESYSQRVGLIFILVLTLMVKNVLYSYRVAQVTYVKALDVWMILCLLFVFAVLLESTIVKVVASRGTGGQYEQVQENSYRRKKAKNSKIATVIDKVSRVAFPLVFLLSMIIFFGLYRG